MTKRGFDRFFPVFIKICLALLFCFHAGQRASQADTGLVGVLISREIKPFITMVEGLEARLSLPVVRVFLDKNSQPYSSDPRFDVLASDAFTHLVAVGPGALSYLAKREWSAFLIYGMVLNPDHILGQQNRFCGVSLNLPAHDQISAIRSTFPDLQKLGVLYDPANNQAWVEKAALVARDLGVKLAPLAVNDRSEISGLFGWQGPGVDAILFIPDRTVISKAIIGHVIKTAVYHGIPCIGYNRYFFESGAALSFVIDYAKVGEQVALRVEQTAAGGTCRSSGPPYEALINETVIKTLNLRVRGPALPAEEKSP